MSKQKDNHQRKWNWRVFFCEFLKRKKKFVKWKKLKVIFALHVCFVAAGRTPSYLWLTMWFANDNTSVNSWPHPSTWHFIVFLGVTTPDFREIIVWRREGDLLRITGSGAINIDFRLLLTGFFFSCSAINFRRSPKGIFVHASIIWFVRGSDSPKVLSHHLHLKEQDVLDAELPELALGGVLLWDLMWAW